MKPVKSNLAQILAHSLRITVPMYQRKYDWDREKIKIFWEDLMKVSDSSKSLHYMGSMVRQDEVGGDGNLQNFMVIDGQQRITTLLLLMFSLKKVIEELRLAEDPEVQQKITERLVNLTARSNSNDFLHITRLLNGSYFQHREDDGAIIRKFQATEFDRDSFNKLVYENNPDRRKVHYKHAAYFAEKIREALNRLPDNSAKVDFIHSLLDSFRRMNFVYINLELHDNPQQIFESINYKGKPLTVTDLVRNHILKIAPDTESSQIVFERIWKPLQLSLQKDDDDEKTGDLFGEFFRAYASMVDEVTTDGELYATLADLYHTVPGEDTHTLVNRLLGLTEYAAVYEKLVFCSSANRNTPLGKIIHKFSRLNFITPMSLMMKFYKNDRRTTAPSNEHLSQAFGVLESYFVRRALLGRTVKGLAELFSELCKVYDLETVDDYNFAQWLKGKLENLTRDEPFRQLKPVSDEDFKRESLRAEVYANSRTITRYALSELELILSGAESVELSKAEIEHVMPQELSEWRTDLRSIYPQMNIQQIEDNADVRINTLGNLTLTADKFNKHLSNKCFLEKRNMDKYGYASSNLKITREYFASLDKWNFESIEERTAILTDKILTRFNYNPI